MRFLMLPMLSNELKDKTRFRKPLIYMGDNDNKRKPSSAQMSCTVADLINFNACGTKK